MSTDELEFQQIPGVFFGSLARDFQPGPLAALQDEWATKMPKFREMQKGVQVLATERKELTSSMLQTSCYDSVVAVAVAVDNLLEKLDGKASAITDLSAQLGDTLDEGVYFESLGAYNERSGAPWVDPESRSPVLNYVHGERIPVSSPAEVNYELSFVSTAAVATTAPPTPIPTAEIIISGNIPGSYVPTPCTLAECGEGTCEPEPALGRLAGWCECPIYLVGKNCQWGGSMDKPPPDFDGVAVSLVQTRLEGFNEEGDGVNFKLTVKIEFTDYRLSLLDGIYQYTQVDILVEEKKLWLPEPVLTGFRSHLPNFDLTRSVTITGTQVKYEIEIRGEKNADADYRFYPFDEQVAEFLISFSPGITWLSPFPTTDTAELAEPGDGWTVMPNGWNVHVAQGSQTQTLFASMKVYRDRIYFLIRVFVPSVILVCVSWSGFFIKPQLLMPRFASGFISFLALQTFIATARKDMPAKLTRLCWIDAYTTFIGLLMGFACVENVSAQYIYENFSESITTRLDRASRKAFPSAFVIGCTLLWWAWSVPVALIFSFCVLAALGGSLTIWTWYQIHNFPKLATRRAIAHYVRFQSMVSPSRRLVPFAFPTSREMSHLFHAIDHDEKEEITIDNWIHFIENCDQEFAHNREYKEMLENEMRRRFGKSLDPSEFPVAFEECVRLIGHLKRTGSVEGLKLKLSPAKLTISKSMINGNRGGDGDGDPEEEGDPEEADDGPEREASWNRAPASRNGGSGTPRSSPRSSPANGNEKDGAASSQVTRRPLNRDDIRPDIHL
jgi:hypothetical protein